MGALERLQQLGLASGLSQKEVNPDVTPRRNQGASSAPANHRFTDITTPSGGGLGAVDSSGVLSALQEKADIQRKLATDPRLRSLNSRMALASAMRGEDAFQKYAVQPRLAAADADLAIAEKKKLLGFGNNAFAGFGKDAAYLSQLYKADPKAAIDLANKIREKQATSQAKNLELTNTEKNLAAAGIDPASAQGIAAILGDNDLTTYEKKQQIQQKFNLESKAIDQLFTAGQAETQFQRDLMKQLNQGQIDKEKFLAQYGPGGKEAFEKRKEIRQGKQTSLTKTLEEAQKDLKTASASILPANELITTLMANPNLTFSGAQKLGSNIAAWVGKENDDISSVRTAYKNLQAAILPLAKTLGANPSNRDVKVIEGAFGSGSRGEMLGTALQTKVYSDLNRKIYDEISRLQFSNPDEALRIREEYITNYEKYIEKAYLDEINKLEAQFPESFKDIDRLKNYFTSGERAKQLGYTSESQASPSQSFTFTDEDQSLINQYTS